MKGKIKILILNTLPFLREGEGSLFRGISGHGKKLFAEIQRVVQNHSLLGSSNYPSDVVLVVVPFRKYFICVLV